MFSSEYENTICILVSGHICNNHRTVMHHDALSRRLKKHKINETGLTNKGMPHYTLVIKTDILS